MSLSHDQYEVEEAEQLTVNPWLMRKLDSSRQTGGEWYLTLLSASVGFKAIHGANTAPTCEVVCKGASPEESLTGHGMVKWDGTQPEEAPRPIGRHISDQFYTKHRYKGTVTKSGSLLAYEGGMWEPSVRRRAKSSALLAASIYAHGGSKADAIETVSKIAADKIDPEAVESALLPASHLKREMVLVSKANHRVFSQGTLQSGITWDDRYLTMKDKSATIAFDWGRVTALARSIAEANVQTCSRFREIATRPGVPYGIVKNSWAYVSESDYMLTSEQFAKVPDLNIEEYGLPSLKGTFAGHEHDIMVALSRTKRLFGESVENDAMGAYRKLHSMARRRLLNRKGKRVADSRLAKEVRYHSHNITGDTAMVDLELSDKLLDAFVKAVKMRRTHDVEFRTAVDRYRNANAKSAVIETVRALDDLTALMYAKPSWVYALSIAEEDTIKELGEDGEGLRNALDEVTMGLHRMKEGFVGHPTHLTADVDLLNSAVVTLRVRTKDILARSDEMVDEPVRTQRGLTDSVSRETADALNRISTVGAKALKDTRKRAYTRYMEWFEMSKESRYDMVKFSSTKFAYAAYAIKHLEASSTRYKASGYVDGAAPRMSYVYQCTKFLCNHYGIETPKLKYLIYSGAQAIAQDLEVTVGLKFSVVEGVEYAVKVLDKVIAALFADEPYIPRYTEYDDFLRDTCPPVSPGYDDSMMVDAEAEDIIMAMMMAEEEDRNLSDATPYEECLNSYPSAVMAEEYARENGYPSFLEAFAALGHKCSYYEDHDFVVKAKVELAKKKAVASSSNKKRSYELII